MTSRLVLCFLLALLTVGRAQAGGPVFVDLAAGAQDARIAGSNPAGMSRLEDTAWRTGLIVSYSESTWVASSSGLGIGTETDSDSTLYIPSLFYVRPLNERWAVGVSLSATGGLGDDSSDNSVTRYLSTDWSIGSLTFQPAVQRRPGTQRHPAAEPAGGYHPPL